MLVVAFLNCPESMLKKDKETMKDEKYEKTQGSLTKEGNY